VLYASMDGRRSHSHYTTLRCILVFLVPFNLHLPDTCTLIKILFFLPLLDPESVYGPMNDPNDFAHLFPNSLPHLLQCLPRIDPNPPLAHLPADPHKHTPYAGSMSRKSVRSGTGSDTSGARHHEYGSPLAAVNATPEKAYLSQSTVVPAAR